MGEALRNLAPDVPVLAPVTRTALFGASGVAVQPAIGTNARETRSLTSKRVIALRLT